MDKKQTAVLKLLWRLLKTAYAWNNRNTFTYGQFVHQTNGGDEMVGLDS